MLFFHFGMLLCNDIVFFEDGQRQDVTEMDHTGPTGKEQVNTTPFLLLSLSFQIK